MKPQQSKKRVTFSVEQQAGDMVRDYAHQRGRMVESVLAEVIRIGIPILTRADEGRSVMISASAAASPPKRAQ